MNVIAWLIERLVAAEHRKRRGHEPVWYDLGAGERQCVECLRGGHRRRVPRLKLSSPLRPMVLPL